MKESAFVLSQAFVFRTPSNVSAEFISDAAEPFVEKYVPVGECAGVGEEGVIEFEFQRAAVAIGGIRGDGNSFFCKTAERAAHVETGSDEQISSARCKFFQ